MIFFFLHRRSIYLYKRIILENTKHKSSRDRKHKKRGESEKKKKRKKTAKLKWQTEAQGRRNNGDTGQSENKR